MRRTWTLCGLALAGVIMVSAAGANKRQTGNTKACFEKLKSLKGEWTGKSPLDGKEGVMLRYRLTAGGHTVEETEFPGHPHEMVTMFSLDGEDLVLTHYCSAGNQPKMKLKAGSTPEKMHFECIGGGNLKNHNDGHMHSAVFSLSPGKLRNEWTMLVAGKEGHKAIMECSRK